MDINDLFRFGLNFSIAGNNDNGGFYFRDAMAVQDAEIVLVSAPWAVTSAAGQGAAYTPDAIIDASTSVSLYDAVSGISIEGKVATAEVDYDLQESSLQLGGDAAKVVSHIEDGGTISGDYFLRKIGKINIGFRDMHRSVGKRVFRFADKGKIVGVVGGDHSVSLGAVRSISSVYPDMGVLFIDGHCDLRQSGKIFAYSHLSIARNIIDEVPQIAKLVQVGARDMSLEEAEFAASHPKIALYGQEKMARDIYNGENWHSICEKIVSELPEKVYISLDIDALTPEHCPNTKRPVAGGMTFDQVVYLINCVAESGRNIIGFDLTEIVPENENNIDAAIGARMLVKLCAAALKSKNND
ncbi:MAG: arginase family protein [Alistipes sp.]|nr:arginase family protein [Alistipes sp.]